MEEAEASRRGLHPLGIYRGMAVAGCAPDEMGIGPVFAVPKLLQKHGLTVDDIDLWELNGGVCSPARCCIAVDRLGIPHDKLERERWRHFDRASVWHVRRARLVGHALIEGKRRGAETRGGHDVRRRGGAWVPLGCVLRGRVKQRGPGVTARPARTGSRSRPLRSCR